MAFEINQLNFPKDVQPAAAVRKPTAEQLKAAEERVVLEEERIYRRGVVSIKDLIAPASFEVTPDYVRLGDTYGADFVCSQLSALCWGRLVGAGY